MEVLCQRSSDSYQGRSRVGVQAVDSSVKLTVYWERLEKCKEGDECNRDAPHCERKVWHAVLVISLALDIEDSLVTEFLPLQTILGHVLEEVLEGRCAVGRSNHVLSRVVAPDARKFGSVLRIARPLNRQHHDAPYSSNERQEGRRAYLELREEVGKEVDGTDDGIEDSDRHLQHRTQRFTGHVRVGAHGWPIERGSAANRAAVMLRDAP